MTLSDNNTYYQALFQTSDTAMLIATKKKLLDCNEAAIHLFNTDSKDDLLAYHPTALLTEWNTENSSPQQNKTHHAEWFIKGLNTEPILSQVCITLLDSKQSLYSIVIKPLKAQSTQDTINKEVFTASSDALFLIKSDKLIDCNDAAIRLFNASGRSTLLSLNIEALSPDRQEDNVPSNEKSLIMVDLMFQKGFHRYKWLFRKCDNSTFPAEVTLTPIFIAGEIAIYAAIRDLTTDRKRRHQLYLLNQAIEQSIDGIGITDLDGNIIFINQSCLNLHGKTQEQVIGQPMADLHTPEQMQNDMIPLFEKTLSEGHASTEVSCGPDGINKHKVQLTTTLLTDKKGYASGLLAISHDLNELQLSHQQLDKETARRAVLSQLLNSSLNVKTEQQFINESLDILLSLPLSFLHNKGAFFLMQGKPAQLVMQASRNLATELHTLCAKVPLGHCLCGRAAATGEIQFASCLDDRHEITFAGIGPHGHYNLPFFLDGKVEGVVVVYLEHGAIFSQEDHDLLSAAADILSTSLKRLRMEAEIKTNNELLELRVSEQTTQLRKTAELANAANIAKSRFLANMSHELRTPLHGILSFARYGLKKDIVNKPDKILKYFDRINTSGERLLRILNDLLDLAKLEAGQMAIEKQLTDLRSVANTSIADQEAWMSDNKLQLSWNELTITETKAHFDATRIGQVITNLLSNAIKFTPEGKSLIVAIFNDELIIDDVKTPALRFSLSDEGSGIPDDELEAVFDKFIQSSKVHSGTSGTGLGLAICKEIIEAHNGKIWAEHSPSGGSCFQFIIPCNN